MFRSTIFTAFAVIVATLVPASSATADPGSLPGSLLGEEVLSEKELGAATETGADSLDSDSAVGEFPSHEGLLVATEYQGNRVAVSTEQLVELSWVGLQNDELDATRTLIGDVNAYGRRFTRSNNGAHYLAMVNSDGFSVLIEIISEDSSKEHVFNIELPDATTLILTDEGSVDLLDHSGYTIGEFEAPWALDADGNTVPTTFKVDGNTISQVIEANETTVYPVLADPRFTWGWFSGTVYFNKWETMALCSGSFNTLRAMVILPFWLPILLAIAGTLFVFSCTARLLDKCIKAKSNGSVTYYTGGYCTW